MNNQTIEIASFKLVGPANAYKGPKSNFIGCSYENPSLFENIATLF